MRGGSDLSGVEWRPGHFLYGNPTKDGKQFLFTPTHLGDWGHLNGTVQGHFLQGRPRYYL